MEGLDRLATTHPKNERILSVLARWYSQSMLIDVLAILKADYCGSIRTSPIRAYLYRVPVAAHERGLERINDCGSNCKHCPQNRLPLEQKLRTAKTDAI